MGPLSRVLCGAGEKTREPQATQPPVTTRVAVRAVGERGSDRRLKRHRGQSRHGDLLKMRLVRRS